MKKWHSLSPLLSFASMPQFTDNYLLMIRYKKAQANYPQVKQYGLIEQSKEFNLSNANKGYLPQVSLSAKATYQSAVTKLPITLPNVTIEGLNKDQYQSVVEVLIKVFGMVELSEIRRK